MQHASPPVQPQSSHEPFLCSVQLQAHTIVRIDCTVHCLTLEWMPTEERANKCTNPPNFICGWHFCKCNLVAHFIPQGVTNPIAYPLQDSFAVAPSRDSCSCLCQYDNNKSVGGMGVQQKNCGAGHWTQLMAGEDREGRKGEDGSDAAHIIPSSENQTLYPMDFLQGFTPIQSLERCKLCHANVRLLSISLGCERSKDWCPLIVFVEINIVLQHLTGWDLGMSPCSSVQQSFIYYPGVAATRTTMTMQQRKKKWRMFFFPHQM